MNELPSSDDPAAGGVKPSTMQSRTHAAVDASPTQPWGPVRGSGEAASVSNERRAPTPADPEHVLRAMLVPEPARPPAATGLRRLTVRGKRAVSAVRPAPDRRAPVIAESPAAPATGPFRDAGTGAGVGATSAGRRGAEARTHDTLDDSTTTAGISADLDRRHPSSQEPQGASVEALADRVASLTRQISDQSAQFANALADARDEGRRQAEAQRARYDDDLAALAARHQRELATRSVAVGQQPPTQDDRHARAIAALEAEHRRVLVDRDRRHEQSLKVLVAEHEQALDAQAAHELWSYKVQREQHAETVAALVAMHDKSIGALRRQLATEKLRSDELARRLASDQA